MRHGRFSAKALAVLVASASPAFAAGGAALPWINIDLAPGKRAVLLVRAMTLGEKFEQLLGTPGVVPELPQCYGARHVDGIPRLRIPTLRITNGPVGIGQSDCVPLDTPGLPSSALSNVNSAKAIALPSALAVAVSFDPAAVSRFGDVLGAEARNLGLQVLEGPGMNLARVPQGGRDFGYFGEDPMLSGTMAVTEIRAVQQRGVIAMAKHFMANEQETDRFTIQEAIDDRVLHELYLLPFEMSVKEGKVASVMCSYNSVNGPHMCENGPLLTGVLRGQWRFDGYVQSDFFAVHSVAPTLRAGMDLEMPGLVVNISNPPLVGPYFTSANLRAALDAGQIAVSDIDTALGRRYKQMFRLGVFDRLVAQTPIDAAADGQAAQAIGEQTAVLLKNTDNVLPLDLKAVRSIAVIGQPDYAAKAVSGCCGGSSDVIPPLHRHAAGRAARGGSGVGVVCVGQPDRRQYGRQ